MILQLPDGTTVGKAALHGDRWAWDMIHGALEAERTFSTARHYTTNPNVELRLFLDGEACGLFATRALGYIEGQVRMLPTIAGQLA